MADDADKPTEVVRDEIDLGDEAEVRRWASQLGVNEAQLRHAVRSAGNNATAVRAYLEAR